MSRFARKNNPKKQNKVIRIYTEGTKTEPNYFGSIRNELRLSEVNINIFGLGDHTMPLVDYVILEKEKDTDDTDWWVVFDKDDHSQFNESIDKAKSHNINVAYSNESFELWFVLHFEYLQVTFTRDMLNEKMTKLLGQKYEKNTTVYSIIKDKENIAIRNAKNLEKMHDDQNINSSEKRNPSTTVYRLVEALRNLKN